MTLWAAVGVVDEATAQPSYPSAITAACAAAGRPAPNPAVACSTCHNPDFSLNATGLAHIGNSNPLDFCPEPPPPPAVNQAPNLTLNPTGSQTVMEGQTLNISASATDPDGNPVTIAAAPLPTGASFDGSAFVWTPAAGSAGSYDIAFTATDQPADPSQAKSTVTSVGITVTATPPPPPPPASNQAPSLVLTPSGDQTVTEGQAVSIAASATDPDSDPVTITAAPLPTGATFDGSAFAWTPAAGSGGASGTPYSVTFTATDQPANATDALSATQPLTITVMPPTVSNHAPVLDVIPSPQNATVGQALKFTVSATDQDSDTLTLGAANLPTGATFTPKGLVNGKWSGEFAWTPTAGQPNATVSFTVLDDFSSPAQDSQDVAIQVSPATDNTSTIKKLEIGQAVWNARKSTLVVRGSVKLRKGQSPTGLSVTLFNDATGEELGQAPVGRKRVWTFSGPAAVCKVRAELGGKVSVRKVSRVSQEVCSASSTQRHHDDD
ncbi:MAG TPA: putative Ig domain-containing protein [Methylococcaceae bacterium]|nr:putative Ig domain-containing protein [Methylococcaceae bacterium]